MTYAVEMGSGAKIYIDKFNKDWFGHSNVDSGEFTDTQTAWRPYKPNFIFSK
jgi:hypothetical protein